MQIPSLAQEVPKPGIPEADGAPAGCSTLQVCAYLAQLQGEAEPWSTAPEMLRLGRQCHALASQGIALLAAIARVMWSADLRDALRDLGSLRRFLAHLHRLFLVGFP